MANVTLNDDEMSLIVQKAILDGMGPEKRDELIKTAVKELLARPNDSAVELYGTKAASRIQQIFNQAVTTIALKIAEEHCRTPEIENEIKRLLVEAVNKAFHADGAQERLVERMADAVRKAITGDRY